MAGIVVWPGIILDFALWVNSKIDSISTRLSYTLISFLTEWRQIHDVGVFSWALRYTGIDVWL